MTFTARINDLASNFGLPPKLTRQLIRVFLTELEHDAAVGPVVLPRFGVFEWRERPPKRVRTPDGKWHTAPARTVLVFRATKRGGR